MASGGHHKGLVATHQCCYGNTWYVMLEEEEMAKTLGKWNLWDKECVCPSIIGNAFNWGYRSLFMAVDIKEDDDD